MITAYPMFGKSKSLEICRAFVAGCGGIVAKDARQLLDGPAFFYGVNESNLHLWRQAEKDLRRDYFYADNSYFDKSRQQYFRVTRNRLQHSGSGQSDGTRFAALGIPISPWKTDGTHIVVCPQSAAFMRDVVGRPDDWLEVTLLTLRHVTSRPLLVRQWERDKTSLAATLAHDLERAYALVTWSSAAAVSALLAGVPVIVSDRCAAFRLSGSFQAIEYLPRPTRETWAGVLADNQWTLNEMRSGEAWAKLNGE